MKPSREFVTAIIVVLIIAVVKLGFHELWKDEWQSWLIARDMTLSQIISFLHYEGHPALWYLWLKGFTFFHHFISEPILINMAHLIVVSASIYWLFMKMELPYYIKILIAFSYFIGFEYGIVNRGYILVILLSFMTIYYFKNKHHKLLYISLFLMCHTEVYGTLIAIAILFYIYLQDQFMDIKPYVYTGLSILLFTLSVYPSSRTNDLARAYNDEISSTIMAETIQGHFANVFAVGLIQDTATVGSTPAGILLSLFILFVTIYIFMHNKAVAGLWVVGFLLLLTFSAYFYTGGLRQWGMLFIVFILCLELTPTLFKNNLRHGLVILLLICPIVHNARAIYNDLLIPFSNAKEAGQFISAKVPANVAIVAINKFETAPVAAYAKRKFFELPLGKPFSYFKWLERVYIPTQSELILFTKFKKAKGLIVITHMPIDPQRFPLLKLWQKFDKENFKSEEYYLYTMAI